MHAQLDVGKQRKCNRLCAFTRGLLKVPPTCEKEYKKTKAIFMLCSSLLCIYKLSGSHFQSRVRSSLDKTSKIKSLGFFSRRLQPFSTIQSLSVR